MAVVIVIEGRDGIGKATQVGLLAAHCECLGRDVTTHEIPYYSTPSGRTIRRMLKSGTAATWPRFFQFVQFLNKLRFQLDVLEEEAYVQGKVVILDRWSLSSVVYGLASGLSEGYVMALYGRLARPTVTIVLVGQSHRQRSRDVYEDDFDMQSRVDVLYRKWASEHPGTCILVDTTGRSREEVHELIVEGLRLKGLSL